MAASVVSEMIRLEFGPQPMRLVRAVVGVPCTCPRCSAAGTYPLIVGAHWWDREAAERQRDHARGLACGRCGALIDLPVPLVQYRRLDAADLVVGLPLSSAAESDMAWIGAVVDALRGQLETKPAVVTVRMPWWPHVDRVPLGPALAGLAGPPEFAESPEERDQWLAATRAALSLPDIPQALARFVTASSVPRCPADRRCRACAAGPAVAGVGGSGRVTADRAAGIH